MGVLWRDATFQVGSWIEDAESRKLSDRECQEAWTQILEEDGSIKGSKPIKHDGLSGFEIEVVEKDRAHRSSRYLRSRRQETRAPGLHLTPSDNQEV
ncbi:MAG: hypothetical protein HYY48_01095 [Gammaproteobacteria bacterium]|nr:hypothetical protein [Gammaproteobacteria bacterium]